MNISPFSSTWRNDLTRYLKKVFGNGNLEQISQITLLPNQVLSTDGGGQIGQSSLTAKGRSIIAAPDNDTVLATILAAPRPATSGRGLFAAFQTSSGAAAVLPAGGSYAYWMIGYEASSGSIRAALVGDIKAGGSTMASGVAGWIWSGAYWNLT